MGRPARRAADPGLHRDQYERDALLRTVVERQFEGIGEALNKLKRADPDIAARIADLPKLVAIRNILAHGYATIDNVLVWQFANTRLVELSDGLDRLMESPNSG